MVPLNEIVIHSHRSNTHQYILDQTVEHQGGCLYLWQARADVTANLNCHYFSLVCILTYTYVDSKNQINVELDLLSSINFPSSSVVGDHLLLQKEYHETVVDFSKRPKQ